MKNRVELLLSLGIFFLLFFLTIGYASYSKTIALNSNVTLSKPGVIEITGISVYDEGTLPTGSGGLSVENGQIKMNYKFTVTNTSSGHSYYATYLIKVDNNSPYDYTFSGFALEPTVTHNSSSGADSAGATITYEYVDVELTEEQGIPVGIGEDIPAYESRTIPVMLHFLVKSRNSNTNVEVGGSVDVNTSTDNSGSFYGGIVDDPITLDLTAENISDCFYVDITNTYKTKQMYNFSLTSSNFVLVDNLGNALGSYEIDPPSENSEENVQNLQLCITEAEGSVFAASPAKTQVVVNPTGLSGFSIGTISIKVDVDEDIGYTGAPQIENVSFTPLKYNQEDSSLSTTASWTRIDTDTIDVEKWYIELYADSGTSAITTFEVPGDENISNYELVLPNSVLTSTAFTSALTNSSNFYIKVYGKYPKLSSGGSRCDENANYCVNSSSVSLKYQFTLTYTGNATMTNTTDKKATIYLKNPFSSTITTTTTSIFGTTVTYNLNGVTVTKTIGEEATTLENNTHYSYAAVEGSATTANFSIFEDTVDGDIAINIATTSEGCLIKGTKIKVYGGYKNVEDIKYNDLLAVYSYDLGREVYEYPIIIEEEGTTNYYQKITFSDGSTLNLFGDHGIFSKDANEFVSILDRDKFHIGTNVLKSKNGKLISVKVAEIEYVYKDTTFYNISSTRYLNVIANDFVTTDPLLPISNNFGFNIDLTWSSNRDEYLRTNDLISYELLKNYFPKYLYDGIRMGEAKNLLNQSLITVPEYVARFSKMHFVDIPVDKDGNNKWMVTTSIDLENNLKGNYYIEGSYYKLPKAKTYINKNFIGWYNSADNKYYQSGDLVRVSYGMYFEAVYEEVNLFRNELFS